MRRLLALAAGFAVMAPAFATDVAAQRYAPNYNIDSGAYVFSKTTRHKRAPRGYSGWYPGATNVFCDYERTPIRSCRGRRCRTTGWVMKQYCY